MKDGIIISADHEHNKETKCRRVDFYCWVSCSVPIDVVVCVICFHTDVGFDVSVSFRRYKTDSKL